MAKTSFKLESEEVVIKSEGEAKPLAVKTETALAVPNESGDDFVGYDAGMDDIITPRLNLVAKTGDLSNAFQPGTYVFNKIVALNKDNKTGINITVLKAVKQFQEIIKPDENGDSPMPRRANTPEEVAELGGTLKYEQKDVKQLWGPMADLLVMVEQPEGELPSEAEGQFYVEIDGKNYAPAKWTIAKTAYKSVYPHIKTAVTTWAMKDGLISAKWKLSATLEKGKAFSWWQPLIKGAGLNTPETIALLKELRSRLAPSK